MDSSTPRSASTELIPRPRPEAAAHEKAARGAAGEKPTERPVFLQRQFTKLELPIRWDVQLVRP